MILFTKLQIEGALKAISMGPSGNLSGGQRFLASDTGKRLLGIAGKKIPCLWLLSAVSMCLVMPNILCWCPTNHLGCVFGDCTHNVVGKAGDEDESVVNDLYASILLELSKMLGVSLVEEDSAE
jgi:hypothetical protein